MGNLITVSSCIQPVEYAFECVTDPYRRITMPWGGTVGELLDRQPGAAQSLRERFWGPSLVMQAVLESATSGADRRMLVADAAAFALEIYSRGSSDRLGDIRKAVTELGLLEQVVDQKADSLRVAAADAGISYYTATQLAEATNDHLLYIPLGPKGLVAGLQTALFHARIRGAGSGDRSVVYPVRFDLEAGDRQPYLADEVSYLSSLAINRTAVVLADVSRGDTLEVAKSYFKSQLTDSRILAFANVQ